MNSAPGKELESPRAKPAVDKFAKLRLIIGLCAFAALIGLTVFLLRAPVRQLSETEWFIFAIMTGLAAAILVFLIDPGSKQGFVWEKVINLSGAAALAASFAWGIWHFHPRLPTVKPHHLVFVMDTHSRIYDEGGKREGATNGHDIRDRLNAPDFAHLDVELEPTFPSWDGTQYLFRRNPKLIIIHFSAFRNANEIEGPATFEDFTRHMRDASTKFLVYSRRWQTEPDATNELRQLSTYNSLIAAKRLFPLPLGDLAEPSFRRGPAFDRLAEKVREVLP